MQRHRHGIARVWKRHGAGAVRRPIPGPGEGAAAAGDNGPASDAHTDPDSLSKHVAINARMLAKRWLWGAVAGVSLGLGLACFILARRVKTELKFKDTRRWSKR